MNAVRQSSEKPASAGLKGKPQPDLPEKEHELHPWSSHAVGNARSFPPGDSSSTQNWRHTAGTLHPVAQLQQSLGNQAVQRRMQSGLDPGVLHKLHQLQPIIGNQGVTRRLQAKLKVNTPGDQHEQEADRVAEQVMCMPAPGVAAPAMSSAVSGVQRKCACGGTCSKCKTGQPGHEHEHLQMKPVGSSDMGQTTVPPIVHEVLTSPGQPFDTATRAFMEPRFGQDFSGVRVHANSQAADSARAIHARAYTAGHDLVFAGNQFSPATSEGKKLLAHELTHVVQQSHGPTVVQRDPESGFERIKTIANQEIIVGMQATIEVSGDPMADIGIGGGTALAEFRGERAKALGGTGRAAQLPQVEHPGTTGKEGFTQPSAGFVVEPLLGSHQIEVVAWNTGDRIPRANVSHAETQFENWFNGRSEKWTNRVKSVTVTIFGHDICPGCERLLKNIERSYPHIKFTWSRGDSGGAGSITPKTTPSPARTGNEPGKETKPDASTMPQRRRPKTPATPPPTTTGGEKAVKSDPTAKTTSGGTLSTTTHDEQHPSAEPRLETKFTESVGVPELHIEGASAKGQAKGQLAEFSAQVLQSMQLDNLRSAEKAKALARFEELAPEIERLLSEGNTVTVVVEADVPASVDIAGFVTGTGDITQVVFFRRMYIEHAYKSVRDVPAGQAVMSGASEIGEKFADQDRDFDPHHDLTLNQQIRMQMGDPDPAKKHQPRPGSRFLRREQTFAPSVLTALSQLQRPPAQPAQAKKPPMDPAVKKALALAPSRVYLLSENVIQSQKADQVVKSLSNMGSFVVVKSYLTGGFRKSRTLVVYFSDLDQARAKKLAAILRLQGLPEAYAELSGGHEDDAPGVLQIMFGRDAEK